jgi:hypothetical protein
MVGGHVPPDHPDHLVIAVAGAYPLLSTTRPGADWSSTPIGIACGGLRSQYAQAKD